MRPYPGGHPHIVERDRVVGSEQHQRARVVEVAPLTLDLLLVLLQQSNSFLAAPAPFLAPADPTLCPYKGHVCFSAMTRRRSHRSIGSDETPVEAHIYACFFAGSWKWLDGDVPTRTTDIPPVRLVHDGDGLGSALERAMHPNENTPDLGAG